MLENVPYTELAPDWLCEIVSPSSVRIDRVRKIPVYACEGVKHLWLIDPLARTVEVYRFEGEHWVLVRSHGDSERMHAESFETIEFDVSRWWLES